MLSERDRRVLARIERQLRESDPDLARLFDVASRPDSGTAPRFLLVTGLALLLTGSIIAAAPIAVAGMVLAVFALVTAHARPSGFRRPGFA